MESWQQSVPLGMETDLSQLRVTPLHLHSFLHCLMDMLPMLNVHTTIELGDTFE